MNIMQTSRLELKPCSVHDKADFIALEQDPEVMRYLNGGHAVEQEESDPESDFLMPRGTEEHVWTARHISTGKFVGWFCLWPDGDRVAELGYRLRRDAWGQGLATEGAEALIRWGFSHGLYDRIFASTMAVNKGSRGVMERIGMIYARTFFPQRPRPIPGSENGEVEYEITRALWATHNLRTAPNDGF